MRRAIPIIKEELKELNEKLRQEKNPRRKTRLHMLVLLKSRGAKTRKKAAEHLAVNRNTIMFWLDLYESGGIDTMLQIKSPGPQPGQYSIPIEVIEELNKYLQEPTGFGSYGQIQNWLRNNYGLDVKYKTVHRIVRYELRAKLKVPRKSHVKKTLPV
jgi:transposase